MAPGLDQMAVEKFAQPERLDAVACRDVLLLPRIADAVVERRPPGAEVLDQLAVDRLHRELTRLPLYAGSEHPLARRRIRSRRREQVAPLHRLRHRDPGEPEHGWHDVGERRQVGDAAAAIGSAGQAHEERDAQLVLVQVLAVRPAAVLEELLAVVRGEHDRRAIEPPGGAQFLDEAGEAAIEGAHAGGIARPPLAQAERGVGVDPFDAPRAHAGHHARRQLAPLERPVGAERLAGAQRGDVLLGRIVGIVHVHEVQVEEEGPLRVAGAEPRTRRIEDPLGGSVVGDVAIVELGEPLGETVVAPDPGVGNERCRVVAGRRERLGECLGCVRQNVGLDLLLDRPASPPRLAELAALGRHPVHRNFEPGEQGGDRRFGPRCLAVGALEDDGFRGEPVDARRDRAAEAVGAEVVGAEGVDENQDQRRRRRVAAACRHGEADEARAQQRDRSAKEGSRQHAYSR